MASEQKCHFIRLYQKDKGDGDQSFFQACTQMISVNGKQSCKLLLIDVKHNSAFKARIEIEDISKRSNQAWAKLD